MLKRKTPFWGSSSLHLGVSVVSAGFIAGFFVVASAFLLFSSTIFSSAQTGDVVVARASASPSPAVEGDLVTLDGSASTGPDLQSLSYDWLQVGGVDVTLEDADMITAAFVAPDVLSDTVLTFTLTVGDGLTISVASVSVTVLFENQPPVGEISDQTFAGVESAPLTVALDDVYSDPDFEPLIFMVSLDGSGVAEVEISGEILTLSPLSKGTVSATATVSDGTADLSDEFTVTVRNTAPAGDIGDQTFEGTVASQITIALDSMYSDADVSDTLSFTASADDPGVVVAEVVGSVLVLTRQSRGVALVSVMVDDGDGGILEDTFAVTVDNTLPAVSSVIDSVVASVGEPFAVDLSGVFSDADGGVLSYSASSSPTGMVSVAVSGSVLTVAVLDMGVATVTITATDPLGASAVTEFLVVTLDLDLTLLSPSEQSIPEGSSAEFTVGTLVELPGPAVLGWRVSTPGLTQLDGDSRAFCRLTADGTPVCLGVPSFMTDIRDNTPTSPNGDRLVFREVVTRDEFICALRLDGTPDCWGRNGRDGTVNGRVAPEILLPPLDTNGERIRFSTIDASRNFLCGLRLDNGEAECWGNTEKINALGTPDPGPFIDIAIGNVPGYACGIRESDGRISCWGDPMRVPDLPQNIDSNPTLANSYTQISTQGAYICAVRAGTGSVECGALAVDSGLLEESARQILLDIPSANAHFTSVSVGSLHACGVKADGSAECWGSGAAGSAGALAEQLNVDGTPVLFSSVAAGNNYSCGIRLYNGQLQCWGDLRIVAVPGTTLVVPPFPEEGLSALPSSGTVTLPAGPLTGSIVLPTVQDLYSSSDILHILTVESLSIGSSTVELREVSSSLTVLDDGEVDMWPGGELPDQTFAGVEDRDAVFDLSLVYRNPLTNPDGLEFSFFTSSDPSVASVGLSFDQSDRPLLTISPVGEGLTGFTLRVTAAGGILGDGVYVTVGNTVPSITGVISTVDLSSGESVSFDVSPYFVDPDESDILTYAVSSSDVSVAIADMSGSVLSLSAEEFSIGTADITVTASDEEGSAVQVFSVTVPGNPPVSDAGSPRSGVLERSPVTLDGSGSVSNARDPDLTYLWTQSSGVSVSLSGSETVTASFTAPEVLGEAVLTFRLVVTDTNGLTSAPSTVSVSVIGVNDPPVANAGDPQSVKGGVLVTLDGTGSLDPDDEELIYSWAQSGGVSVSLSGSETATVTFTAPELLSDALLTFGLLVTDAGGLTSVAVVQVLVLGSTAPIADAGPGQVVYEGEQVLLDGRGSRDPEGGLLTYLWEQTGGEMVSLSSSTSSTAIFPAPEVLSETLLTFSLVVTDGGGLTSAADVVDVVVTGDDDPPTASGVAVPPAAAGGAEVLLGGSGSEDPEGVALTYEWEQIDGVRVTLSGSDTVTAAFIAPDVLRNEVLTFTLTVGDGVTTSIVSVSVRILTDNLLPVGAIPDQVFAGVNSLPLTIALDGVYSDPDSDTLTFIVSVDDPGSVSPEVVGSTLVLVPQSSGVALVTVTVSDEDGGVLEDEFTVTVNNTPPTVSSVIDSAVVSVGETFAVDLSGVFSDADGGVLSYSASSSLSRVVSTVVSGSVLMVTVLDMGVATVTVTASDPLGASAVIEFVVATPDQALILLSPSEQSIPEGSSAEFTVGTLVELPGPAVLGWRVSTPGLTQLDGDSRAFCRLTADGTPVCLGVPSFMTDIRDNTPTSPNGDRLVFREVVTRDEFICALRLDGTPDCWGRNGRDGTVNGRVAPEILLPPLDTNGERIRFSTIDASRNFLCGLRLDNGEAECWGNTEKINALGTPDPGPFIDIAIGNVPGYACGIRESDGRISCWGDPMRVPDLPQNIDSNPTLANSYTQISTQGAYICAVRAGTGSVECGALAVDSGLLEESARQILLDIPSANARFTSVSVGSLHACGVKADGSAECWGSGAAGSAGALAEQLNVDGTPVLFSSVAAGNNYSCGIRLYNGQLQCWGDPGLVALPGTTLVVPPFPEEELSALPSSGTVTLPAGSLTGSIVLPTVQDLYSSSDILHILTVESPLVDSSAAELREVSSSLTVLDDGEVDMWPGGELPDQTFAGVEDSDAVFDLSLVYRNPLTNPGDLEFSFFTTSDPSVASVDLSFDQSDRPLLTISPVGEGLTGFTLRVTAAGGILGDGVYVLVENTVPSVTGAISTVDLSPDESVSFDVSPYFVDPDESDILTYAVSSSDVSVAIADMSGSVLSLSAEEFSIGTADITVTASDEEGSAVQVFSVTVSGDNDLPRADAGENQTVSEGVVVTLDGSDSSDPEDEDLSYLWEQVGGVPVSLSDSATVTAAFTAPNVPGETVLTFRLTVDDGFSSATDMVNVTVTGVNESPVANAGPPQTVSEGVVVTLDGIGSSDPEDEVLSYLWEQVGGVPVPLSDSATVTVAFTAPNVPEETVLTFRLTVDDGFTNATDTVNVTVTGVNESPVANAGPPQTVSEGNEVTLDGSGSRDPEGSNLTYLWEQTDSTGFVAVLSDSDKISARFAAPNVPEETVLTFRLTVNDGFTSAADMINITVTGLNESPVANTGTPQTVSEGIVVMLDGSGSSDPEDEDLSYLWEQVGGVPVPLSDSATVTAAFTAPNVLSEALLTFSLVVTDASGLTSAPSTVVVTVTGDNDAPSADAGENQTVSEGVVVTLDGSGSSDPEDEDLSYLWEQVGGVPAPLSDSDAVTAAFTAPNVLSEALLTFSLVVTDASGLTSAPSTVVVTVSGDNDLPRADAGENQTVSEGVVVTLDGSGSSDPEDENLIYLWEQTDNTGFVVVLSASDAVTAAFTAPNVLSEALLTFSLVVTDASGLTSVPSTVVVTVSGDNDLPHADAGENQTVSEGVVVTLDGSGSSDPEDEDLSYLWEQVGGVPVSLSDSATVTAAFTVPNVPGATVLTFRLTVDDGFNSATDMVNVTVTGVNESPIANAGPPQTVSEGVVVTLDGIGSSDPEDEVLSYLWEQVGGMPVPLSDSATVTVAFTAPNVPEETVLTFRLTVDDGFTNATDTVNVTVTGINESPLANAGPPQTVSEGVVVTLDGIGSSDPEDEVLSYFWEQVGGVAVRLSDSATVTATFTAPEVLSEALFTFSLVVTDANGLTSALSTVVVTVSGDNDLPRANAGENQTVSEGDEATLDGIGSSDPEDEVLSYLWEQVGGVPVSLSDSATVTATFTAPNVPGETVLTFRLTVDDGFASATDTVNVTVTGVNESPLANAGPPQMVSEGDEATLDGIGSSDPEDEILSYLWEQVGGVSVSLSDSATVTATFTAPNVPEETVLTFRLTVDDGFASATDTVNVTITGVNESPVASAGTPQMVSEGVVVMLDGSGSSDPEDEDLSYLWEQVGGVPAPLSDSATVTAAFTAPNVLSEALLTFSLVVADASGLTSAPSTVVMTVTGDNDAPSADAGENQTVSEGVVVTLDGSGSSDPEDENLSYLWEQVSGITVSLSDSATVTAVFMAPNVPGATVLTFRLTVDDGFNSATDMVNVTVTGVNESPIANAGPPQTVSEGVVVTLDGIGSSDPEDEVLSYLWEQVSGVPVPLSDSATVTVAFTAPNVSEETVLTFRLTVDDGFTNATDTVNVTVTGLNESPVANAGTPQTVSEGIVVMLDGIGSSDPEDEVLSYFWEQVGGVAVRLSDSATVTATFTAPEVLSEALLTFSLVVTDANGLTSALSTVVVTVFGDNDAPSADAGENQTVSEGDEATLDGSGSSDPEDEDLNYLWEQVGGVPVPLSDSATVTATFTAPEVLSEALLTFSLVVTDANGLTSALSTVVVTVSGDNDAPRADAGENQTVSEGDEATLDGIGSSDPEDEVLSYLWKQVGGVPVSLSDSATVTAAFTAPNVPGETVLTFRLTVDDGFSSATDMVNVTVTGVNDPPVADAGNDATVSEGSSVRLDGSGSRDPEGRTPTYLWEQTDKTGFVVNLSDSTSMDPTFTVPNVPEETVLTFRLTVNDGVTSTIDTVNVIMTGMNDAPSADAGEDLAARGGSRIGLSGSVSTDPEKLRMDYAWEQTAGVPVVLEDFDTGSPSFTVPSLSSSAILEFTLTVTDSGGLTSTDTVIVTVRGVSERPVGLLPPTGGSVPSDLLLYLALVFGVVFSGGGLVVTGRKFLQRGRVSHW